VKRLFVALLAALLLVGCGEERSGEEGAASLWITRDRGEEVVLTTDVPAGVTAMQALDGEAHVETRFGGRFVQSIDGIEGSLAGRRDWFYFVNGIESDRAATEYRLHSGDVLWWDFREWGEVMRAPVVVGAFPEPFLHGFGGETRPAAVRYESAKLADGARAIGRLIRAQSVAPTSTPVPKDANLFVVAGGGRPALVASLREGASGPGDPVVFTFVGDASRLARNPRLVRYRYRWEP
jgi:Domain of unknown function (DUF4430)